MIVGIPKEIKEEEYRVGITPEAIWPLAGARHSVLVENDSGPGGGTL